MNPRPRHLSLALPLGLVLFAACAPAAPDDGDTFSTTAESKLTSADRVSRYQRIKDVAAAHGLRDKAFLLAGIAYHESGMVMCYAEATQYCAGPGSPDCGGGAVLAGGGDGVCSLQQGGLGMFQFDAGTYADTTSTYGPSILTIEGQVAAAVDFVVRIVEISAYTTNAETDDKALAWLVDFDIGDATLRDQWIRTVLRYYNGCPEGGSCWAPRYEQYDSALTSVLAETHGTAFWASGTAGAPAPAPGSACPGYDPGSIAPIDQKYGAIGGCGSPIGAPMGAELAAPDGVGRYRVFEGGSIYWTERTGAHVVLGRIRDEWKATGWEAGTLGYPLTDETPAPDGVGRYNVFDRGSIYWTPKTDAHAVYGRIRDAWKDAGWEAGPLGYPVDDEGAIAGGRESVFEHGFITWDASTDATHVTLQ